MTGLPETTVMNSDEMIEALIEPAISIIRTVQATLEETPPELLADIFTDGIYLTGGSANLYGFSTLLSKKTKIPVVTFEEPENCVVLGAGQGHPLYRQDGRPGQGQAQPPGGLFLKAPG